MTPAERQASREAARRDVVRAPKLSPEAVTELRRLLGGPRAERPQEGAA